MSLAMLDWSGVKKHYNHRLEIHRELKRLYKAKQTGPFINLLLGISDEAGNYSSAEHKLGPKILGSNLNAHRQILSLAKSFMIVSGTDVPRLIRQANISYLGIGVGSEISCMLRPTRCWVANTRSTWAYLLRKHGYDYDTAEEELNLYRQGDETSEMAYEKWTALHSLLEQDMAKLAAEGTRIGRQAGIKPGRRLYLWADAIASALYMGREAFMGR